MFYYILTSIAEVKISYNAVPVVIQERTSELYIGHVKELEGIFNQKLETIMPGLLCIHPLLDRYGLHHE